jgi:hypothetical protein
MKPCVICGELTSAMRASQGQHHGGGLSASMANSCSYGGWEYDYCCEKHGGQRPLVDDQSPRSAPEPAQPDEDVLERATANQPCGAGARCEDERDLHSGRRR